jgi:hypothetical protein
MALRNKLQALHALGADIMVIQECSRPDINKIARSEGWSSWFVGDNPNKGLAVLAKAPWIIRKARVLKPKWTGKLTIDGPALIELFPVWAHRSESPAAEYIEQVHLLLDIIERALVSPFTIVAGDFNSHSRWDRSYRIKNHTAAVERFHKLGLKSAYHEFSGDLQGAEEKCPTHWHLKNKNKPYHVDYIFLGRDLLPKRRAVVVGGCDDWLSLSDHAPLLVEIDL